LAIIIRSYRSGNQVIIHVIIHVIIRSRYSCYNKSRASFNSKARRIIRYIEF
jgi:hypothetical protein